MSSARDDILDSTPHSGSEARDYTPGFGNSEGDFRSQRVPKTPSSQSYASDRQTPSRGNRFSNFGTPRGDIQSDGRNIFMSSQRSNGMPMTPGTPNSDYRGGRLLLSSPGYNSDLLNHTQDSINSSQGHSTQHDGHRYTDSQTGLESQPFSDSANPSNLIQEAFIWGTTVSIEKTRILFRQFLHNFKLSILVIAERLEKREDYTSKSLPIPEELLEIYDPAGNDAEQPLYMTILEELAESPQSSQNRLNIGIDARHLYCYGLVSSLRSDHHSSSHGQYLYNQLVKYPREMIILLDSVLTEEFDALCVQLGLQSEEIGVTARIFNLRTVKRMRYLDPSDIDSLVSVRGLILRVSDIIPEMVSAFFRCSMCAATVEPTVTSGKIDEPTHCASCGGQHSFQIIHNRCRFIDKQLIKIQELPEQMTEGETPSSIVLYVYDSLVDFVVPGDRVTVTGIFRAIGTRSNPKQRQLRAVFRTFIDAVHLDKTDKKRMKNTVNDAEAALTLSNDGIITSSEVGAESIVGGDSSSLAAGMKHPDYPKVLEISRSPNLYNLLISSLAPSIHDLDDVKKGTLLQLFGGTNKDMGSLGRIRGEINVLLCGDPGTSKSQMLGYIHRTSPRGLYTSGTGSSAVGLTAFVSKDPESREPILESGALVLSDRGVCCIDEFDKMSDSTRSILHEVMEQQTVSVAKAGIVCTLNARTSVLASANPVESKYNPSLSVIENLRLPPTLLSRFDLIYLILDNVNAESDRRLARHLVSLHWKKDPANSPDSQVTSIAREDLMSYISWTRQYLHPVLSDEAKEALVRGYLDMRRLGNTGSGGGTIGGGSRKIISATTRQLESLIRLSEAHARMRLSSNVEEVDVKEAIRLVNVATQRAALDPRTGTINMELLTTGHSLSRRDDVAMLIEDIREEILSFNPNPGKFLTVAEIHKRLSAKSTDLHVSLSRDVLLEALHELASEDSPLLSLDSRMEKVKFLGTKGRSSRLIGGSVGDDYGMDY